MNPNMTDVTIASGLVLKALMTVLFAEQPDRKDRVLALLAKEGGEQATEAVKEMYAKAAGMVQAV